MTQRPQLAVIAASTWGSLLLSPPSSIGTMAKFPRVSRLAACVFATSSQASLTISSTALFLMFVCRHLGSVLCNLQCLRSSTPFSQMWAMLRSHTLHLILVSSILAPKTVPTLSNATMASVVASRCAIVVVFCVCNFVEGRHWLRYDSRIQTRKRKGKRLADSNTCCNNKTKRNAHTAVGLVLM